MDLAATSSIGSGSRYFSSTFPALLPYSPFSLNPYTLRRKSSTPPPGTRRLWFGRGVMSVNGDMLLKPPAPESFRLVTRAGQITIRALSKDFIASGRYRPTGPVAAD